MTASCVVSTKVAEIIDHGSVSATQITVLCIALVLNMLDAFHVVWIS